MAFIIWIIFAFACSFIAGTKNKSALLWFFIGLLFGIFALGVILILPSQDSE